MQKAERTAVRLIGLARRRLERLTQPVVLSEQDLQQTGMNFYNHTGRLLQASGATDEPFFSMANDRIFFTERVAAYFFDGLFPNDDRKPINGRQNKITPQFREYLQERLPVPLTRNPASTELDFMGERMIDKAARDCYDGLLDIGSTYGSDNAHRLSEFFLASLRGKQVVPDYKASYWVRNKIHEVLKVLRIKLDALDYPL